jgi:hypothetical protein
MSAERAIFIPSHGLPETVRAVRFLPHSMESAGESGSRCAGSQSRVSSTIELWLSNYYGDPEGQMLTSRTVTERTEVVFAEKEMPVIQVERALTVVVRDPPARWTVEIDSFSKDTGGHTASHLVTIDNFGTEHESLCDGIANQAAAVAAHAAI